MSEIGIIRGQELEAALEKHYRQYLTGRLQLPQPDLRHIEDGVETGISLYTVFTPDRPHMHPICTEHGFVLEGCLRIRLLDGSGREYEFRRGDYFVLRPGTPYAGKNAAGTRIFFLKHPALNDKTLVEPDEYTRRWLESWD